MRKLAQLYRTGSLSHRLWKKVLSSKIKDGGSQPQWCKSLHLEYLTIPTDTKLPFQISLIIILSNKLQILRIKKLASVLFFVVVKATALKQQRWQFYLHNITTEVSFYIYDRRLSGMDVVTGFCAYNVWITF